MPKRSFNTGGWRPTGRYRLRPRLLGGTVLEEQRELSDGSVAWEKAEIHVNLPFVQEGYILGLKLWNTGRRRVRNGLFGAVVEEFVHEVTYEFEGYWRPVAIPVELPETDGLR